MIQEWQILGIPVLERRLNILENAIYRIFRGEADVNFTKVLSTAFTLVDPEIVKNTNKSSVSFYAFGICVRKSCT
jgi:hypothetical protein